MAPIGGVSTLWVSGAERLGTPAPQYGQLRWNMRKLGRTVLVKSTLALAGLLVLAALGGLEAAQADGEPEPSGTGAPECAVAYIVAWGRNDYGQCVVPEPNTGFKAVAGGGYHSLGLKDDGSIVAWGAGGPGQVGWPHSGQSIVPEPNSGFVAIAANGYFSLGLKADGSIVAWGENTPGQSGV